MTNLICHHCGKRIYSEGAHCENCGARINQSDNLPTIGEDMEQQLKEAKPDGLEGYVVRMDAEAWELDKRGMRLSQFMRGPQFAALDRYDQALVEQQMAHMQGYFAVLQERIDRAKGKAMPDVH